MPPPTPATTGLRPVASTIFRILAGPVAWALHFGAIYFVQSMLCAHGIGGLRFAGIGIVPFSIVALTLAALVVLGIFVANGARPAEARGDGDPAEARFELRLTLLLAALSAIGILWAGTTWTLVPACPQLR